jgi:hypothetical protein
MGFSNGKSKGITTWSTQEWVVRSVRENSEVVRRCCVNGNLRKDDEEQREEDGNE